MERLRFAARQWNIELSDAQLQQFQMYYEMLIETNKVINLTSITELGDVIQKHFLDSLALAYVYPEIADEHHHKALIDVGTGAGFPGIPLKIAFPKLHVTLIDSLNKRVKFLNMVIDRLKLCDILAIHSRAEDCARQNQYRQSFDLCVSRAVANLSTLSEYCLPFVKKEGYFISYKSGRIEEEMAQAQTAVNILGGKIETLKKLEIDFYDAPETLERSFVMIRKTKDTPKMYPRKAGTASKSPL